MFTGSCSEHILFSGIRRSSAKVQPKTNGIYLNRVNDNLIEGPGVITLFKSIRKLTLLITFSVDLSENPISFESVEFLAEAVKELTLLRNLYIYLDEINIEDKGA